MLSANAAATTIAAANAAAAFDGYNDILMKSFILRANTNAAEYSFARKAASIAPRANFGKNSCELYTAANQKTSCTRAYVLYSRAEHTFNFVKTDKKVNQPQ